MSNIEQQQQITRHEKKQENMTHSKDKKNKLRTETLWNKLAVRDTRQRFLNGYPKDPQRTKGRYEESQEDDGWAKWKLL